MCKNNDVVSPTFLLIQYLQSLLILLTLFKSIRIKKLFLQVLPCYIQIIVHSIKFPEIIQSFTSQSIFSFILLASNDHWLCYPQCLMWVRKFSLLIVLVTIVNSGLALTLMSTIPKDPRWNFFFKNAGQIAEKCGESMPIFVNMNMYVSKSCAAIFGEFLKS